MGRPGAGRNFTIVYEADGLEVARYRVNAETELEAELDASALFFEQHPRFDPFDPDAGLSFRFEAGVRHI
jgi:hypothetical protein